MGGSADRESTGTWSDIVDLPPLDDARWDLLLEAVLGDDDQQHAAAETAGLLATRFPAPLRLVDAARAHEERAEDAYA